MLDRTWCPCLFNQTQMLQVPCQRRRMRSTGWGGGWRGKNKGEACVRKAWVGGEAGWLLKWVDGGGQERRGAWRGETLGAEGSRLLILENLKLIQGLLREQAASREKRGRDRSVACFSPTAAFGVRWRMQTFRHLYQRIPKCTSRQHHFCRVKSCTEGLSACVNAFRT